MCVSIVMLFSDLLNARFLVAAEPLALGQLVTRALGRIVYRRWGLHHVGEHGKMGSDCRWASRFPKPPQNRRLRISQADCD